MASQLKHLTATIKTLDGGGGVVSKVYANAIAKKAKELSPVLTGENRDSIEVIPDGDGYSVVVGSDHGLYLEFGTQHMAPQPFFYPAIIAVREDKETIKKASKVIMGGVHV